MSTQRSPVQSPDLPESDCSKDDEDCLNDAIGEAWARRSCENYNQHQWNQVFCIVNPITVE